MHSVSTTRLTHSYVYYTYAWKTILADEGFITTFFNYLHLLPDDRILNTGIAVIAGLTYNFLPFMILPLYAALEKIDPRLLEASNDLQELLALCDSDLTFDSRSK